MELRAGYKQTDVGVIPDEWDCARITDFAKLESGHTPRRSVGTYWNGPIPWVSLHDTDSLDQNYISNTALTITQQGIDNSSARLLPAGTVVFSRTATVGKASILGREMATSQDFANYVCGPRLSNMYLVYLFRGMTRTWTSFMAGSTHKTIYMPTFEKLRIPIPPLAEQRAIAEALCDMDVLMSGLDELIAKKRDLKQAAMQQLLTGQTRLPGFSGDWGLNRLGDICEISMGRTPRRLDASFWSGRHVWLSIADLTQKVVCESKEQITDAAISSMSVVRKGTLLMSFKLSIGRLCFAGCDLYTNEAICAFNNLHVDAEFLYYALSRVDFSLYGKQAVKGYTLNMESLRLIEVRMPERDEQTAIATILSDMDAEIDALEARRAKTRDLKRAMTQELLTGRIRLV